MQETFDSEFSRYLAQSGGVGLGAFMTRTLDAAGERSRVAGGNRGQPRVVRAAAPPARLRRCRRSRAAAAPVSRSTDSVDVPASVDLPLATPVTSAFGWRSDPFTGESRFHRGVDLRAAYGTEVPAASGGTVVCAGERGTYGNLVVVRDGQGVETRYAHLSATLVKEGDVIERRARRSAESGRAGGPRHRTCISRCWSTANVSTLPGGRVVSGEDH